MYSSDSIDAVYAMERDRTGNYGEDYDDYYGYEDEYEEDEDDE